MAVQTTSTKCDGYLHVRFTGTMDRDWIAESGKVFARHWRECCEAQARGMVLDIRDAELQFNVGDRFDSGVVYAESPLAAIRVGILGLQSQTLPDRFFQKVAVNRGANVRVFVDEQEALAWVRAPLAETSGTETNGG